MVKERGRKVVASNRKARHDYLVDRPGRPPTRVVSQAMGLVRKGEAEGYEPLKPIDVPGLA